MAVTTQTAEQALKILYLEVVRDQINIGTSPIYNEMTKTTKDISGKEVRKMAPFGLNGGFGAGGEVDPLPQAGGNNYIQFVSDTKNLYGTIELSDKSIKASKDNAGSFVRLLTAETEGLLNAVKYNLNRMLFTDGSGVLTNCGANTTTTTLEVESTQYLMEGMTIDIRESGGSIKSGGGQRRIVAVDRINNKIKVSGADITTAATDFITVQNSYNNELTGLEQIFKNTGSLYGVNRGDHYWMIPYMEDNIGSISDIKIQKAIDYLESIAGSKPNFLCGSYGVVRSYQAYMEATKRTVNSLDLKGGFKALSYNGIPLYKDKFMPEGTLDIYDLTQFNLHHMGDWEWMEGNGGRILTQVPNYPIWKATLVRYAELICDHPGGQARLTGITEDGLGS